MAADSACSLVVDVRAVHAPVVLIHPLQRVWSGWPQQRHVHEQLLTYRVQMGLCTPQDFFGREHFAGFWGRGVHKLYYTLTLTSLSHDTPQVKREPSVNEPSCFQNVLFFRFGKPIAIRKGADVALMKRIIRCFGFMRELQLADVACHTDTHRMERRSRSRFTFRGEVVNDEE